MYRRVAGPTIVSRAPGLADIVTIEDGGNLSWFTGTFPATIGTGWSPRFTEPSGVAFEPGARPALLVTGDLLLAAAVGADGSLRATTIHPATRTVDAPVEVDPSVTIDTFGPVGLGLAAQNAVVLGVDKEGVLRAATRPITGGDWTPLLPVLSSIKLSPLGGVTAVTIDIGVMAIVVGVDGVPCREARLRSSNASGIPFRPPANLAAAVGKRAPLCRAPGASPGNILSAVPLGAGTVRERSPILQFWIATKLVGLMQIYDFRRLPLARHLLPNKAVNTPLVALMAIPAHHLTHLSAVAWCGIPGVAGAGRR